MRICLGILVCYYLITMGIRHYSYFACCSNNVLECCRLQSVIFHCLWLLCLHMTLYFVVFSFLFFLSWLWGFWRTWARYFVECHSIGFVKILYVVILEWYRSHFVPRNNSFLSVLYVISGGTKYKQVVVVLTLITYFSYLFSLKYRFIERRGREKDHLLKLGSGVGHLAHT